MKRLLWTAALAVATVVVTVGIVSAQNPMSDQATQVRTLQGQVMDDREAPLPDAIVYLKNTKTLTVKTYIAGKDGSYRFNALSPNIDYEVYAEHDGKKSDTKTLSSFDNRKTANINLKVR